MIVAHGELSVRKDAELRQRDIEIARHEAQLCDHQLLIEKLNARLEKQLRDRFGSAAEGLEQLRLMLKDLEITHSASLSA